MGKRKFSSLEGPPKKSKRTVTDEENAQSDNESVQPQSCANAQNEEKTPSIHHEFDIKHFRKELASKQGQTMVLTQFLQVCLNPDSQVDYLLEYLKTGGNSHEILRQVTTENKKNLTLATPAFHIFHLIVMKVQSTLPHMISVTEEACRYFLNTFMSTVEIMISENSGPRHRKIVLKLLTSMVTLNPDLGIEVLNQAPLTPKHLQYIVEKPNYKEKDNVRTSFVHFMTSLLVDGHLPLIKALLEKQGLLSLVIPGLIQDEAEAVLMFLNILKKNIIDNNFISKSLKLKTFSHQVLHSIFKIFSWKGPPELSNEMRNESRTEIISLLSDILMTLFTSPKLGLYFTDNSLGTVDANKNQLLYKALLSLKRPWENESECETILQIIYKCPDLHRAMINIIEQSFEPQHTPIWERTVEFTVKLLDRLKPEEMVPRMKNLSCLQVTNFVRFISLPIPLLRFIQNNLGKDQTISLYCVKILVKMLQTLRRYMQILEMEDSNAQIIDLKNKLEYFVPKHLPAPSVVVSLIHQCIKKKGDSENAQHYRLPKLDDADALIYLVDLLLLYHDVHPSFFETLEGTLDIKQLLDHSTTFTEGRIALLKFKIVSLWLTLDNTAISLKNPMFKDLFQIMLEIYTNNSDDTWMEAKDTLMKFFKNTSIFEADEDEIHVILYTLRNSQVNPSTMIGDIIEYILENSSELSESIRNQMVHFEICDESSEANLEKIFSDLMENRNTDENIFLENKVPSIFIIGCMQYVRSKKDVKKHLKCFLSLYVANLLHCNYSPELTEVLIGDSKLDVRNYVASWVAQPVPLPEAIIIKDNVIKTLSKTIIDNKDELVTNIFSCLEETTNEDIEFSIDKANYKIHVTKEIDSSELLIWAKYLIFCTIRLTNMNQLTQEQQKKISVYFKCIIEIGKKHHMVDICRSIILSVFKNPHFLKEFRPLDINKHESNILATIFLLEIVTEYQDFVKYLNKKHRMLKSYQQKNYNEIVKAFIKINKRKNVNSDHTVKVLDVIGLSKKDDLRIFGQIFSTELSNCVKEDKEPSIVLELLRILLDKYSRSVNLELPQGTLRKILILYLDLLTNRDITPNMTNLENSLINYFENKPHHIVTVTEDIFKKFFNASVVRKSMSQLASTLLKFNVRLCNVFKEQIVRNEILSQREITLPLGAAIINHNQFLIENVVFLKTIYNEYKTNIQKVLEKPQKASQIYIACWKFIRKLMLECMDVQDCVKLFQKTLKVETVELSHIHLIQAVFLKMCLYNEVKSEHLINYFMSTIHLMTAALKENKDIEILKTLATNMYTILEICTRIYTHSNVNDYQKIFQSSVWQNFCKAVLKDSLKVRTVDQGKMCGPQLLFLLTSLVKEMYPQDHEDIVTIFDMVTSHSEFLNIMLSHHSTDIKSRLLEFIFTLITKNKSVMKSQQIAVYLSAYHATRSPCDRLILSILHYYETNGQPVNEYKPYVFGDSAANHYAVRKNRTSSLWAHPTANQVLNLFEKDVIDRTIRHFPVTQKLEYSYELYPNIDLTNDDVLFDGNIKTVIEKITNDSKRTVKDTESSIANLIVKIKYEKAKSDLRSLDLVHISLVDSDERIYDPVFLLSLLSHVLAPGSAASCFKMLRTGLLAVPVAALASHCPAMRAAAYHVLHRFCLLLDTETRHKNDKLFLTDFINTLRLSLATDIVQDGQDSSNENNPRLPAIAAIYLAKALMVSTAPFDPLYKPVNNFFIAKQQVDLTVVPDFLSLFHDNDVESSERRLWILDVIKNGTKTMSDVNVVFKTMCLKMVMDYASSVLCDRKTQDRILSVLTSVVAIPRAFEILLEGYGLIPWLHSLVRHLERDGKSVVKSALSLIECILRSMAVNFFARNLSSNAKNGKNGDITEIKVNKEIEHEILVILYDLMHHIDNTEVDNMTAYVEVYRLVSKRTIKLLDKRQVLRLINKSGAFYKDSEKVRLLTKSVVKNDAHILKSKIIGSGDDLLKALCDVVNMYIL